jgi:hypothetical protein
LRLRAVQVLQSALLVTKILDIPKGDSSLTDLALYVKIGAVADRGKKRTRPYLT